MITEHATALIPLEASRLPSVESKVLKKESSSLESRNDGEILIALETLAYADLLLYDSVRDNCVVDCFIRVVGVGIC